MDDPGILNQIKRPRWLWPEYSPPPGWRDPPDGPAQPGHYPIGLPWGVGARIPGVSNAVLALLRRRFQDDRNIG